MKKILLLVSSSLLLANSFFAQDGDFDKKFRLGLRVAAQPTWFSSKDNNASKLNTGFGFGFGLVTEFKLSDIVHFGTGIGGDFESGSIKYRYEPVSTPPYSVSYVTDGSGDLKEAEDGVSESTYLNDGDIAYTGVYERKIKTTHITIPITLKMMTKEYSGFRYFGVFGGDLGIRIKARAEDKYTFKTTTTGTTGSGTNTNINIGKDGSLIPLRVGLNVGAGAEYRIAGSTSIFLSINYFRSFTNLMRNESKYLFHNADSDSNGIMTFSHVKQGLLMNAVRINVGILF